MKRPGAIVVTGAAGFLGSAISVQLARQYTVVGIDRREPGDSLRQAAPDITWYQLDIADAQTLNQTFRDIRHRHGDIDVVLHFAAFYHFGFDWHPEYERSNIQGTKNVVQSASDASSRRLIFASSMVAMDPGSLGTVLTEQTPTVEDSPYGRSKSMGEKIVRDASDRLPNAIIRIGGVFSDWCELPPLYSLIKLWSGPPPLNRMIVGNGNTGFPYIHRHDLVRLAAACVNRHNTLSDCEILLASNEGAVVHNQLYPIIRGSRSSKPVGTPLHIPPRLLVPALSLKVAWSRLTRTPCCEHPWMLTYTDRPWVADTTHTQETLHWTATPELNILDRLPIILTNFHNNKRHWHRLNRSRNKLTYAYHPDDIETANRPR